MARPFCKVRKCLDGDGRKQYPQFHLENGQWVKGKPEGPNISFGLPTLIAAPLKATIYFCEGEKDFDALAKLGFISTTVSEGAHAAWDLQLNRNGSGVGPSSWFRMPTSPAVRTQKKSPSTASPLPCGFSICILIATTAAMFPTS